MNVTNMLSSVLVFYYIIYNWATPLTIYIKVYWDLLNYTKYV
jgi:hypothetical protein